MERLNRRFLLLLLLSLASFFLSSSSGQEYGDPLDSPDADPSGPRVKQPSAVPAVSELLLTHMFSKKPSGDPVVRRLCAKTDDVDLCLKSVFSRHKAHVNATTVLQSEIDFSVKAVKKVLRETTKLENTSSIPERTSKCLSTCKETLDSTLDDLRASSDAIDTQDIPSARVRLTGAMTQIVTCNDAFAEFALISPLDKLIQILFKLTSSCLAIANELH